MKRVITTLAITCLLGLSAAYAQKVNGISLKDLNEEYLEIENVSSAKDNIEVTVDYGQKKNTWNSKAEILMDDDNKPMQFKSMMGAINFFYKNGYELACINNSQSKDVSIQRIILKKRKAEGK